MEPILELENIPKRSMQYKVSSRLLRSVIKSVGDVIQKQVDIIQEIWELAQNIASFSSRVENSKEYL
jgi:hypothetical protein